MSAWPKFQVVYSILMEWGNKKNEEVAQDTLSCQLYKSTDFGSHPLKKFLGFEFYIPIFNYRIYLVYLVLVFLWFSLYCCAWTIAVFTTNPSIETGQQSGKKKSQTVKRCRMLPPAMLPNFKKNGSLLQEICVFEVSMPHYVNIRFVKVGTFCCVGRVTYIDESQLLDKTSYIPVCTSHAKCWPFKYWWSTVLQ